MRFNATFSTTITADIQQSEQTLQAALQQVSTGKRVNLPSDDPGASAALVQNLTASARVDQYTSNATSTLSQLQAADSAISSVVSLLNQAVTLGTGGANGSSNASDRQSLATQVQNLLTSVAATANSNFAGAPLFGGTSTVQPPFLASAGSPVTYTYQGNSGTNYVAVGDSLKVQTNVAGNTLFLNPGSSVIGSLQQLVSALSTGTSSSIGTATASVTAALDYLSQQHPIYGASTNQITSQEAYLSQEQVTLSSQQNSLVGIDTATAAEDLAQAETQNSAVLAAAAKVLPTTLLDYLK